MDTNKYKTAIRAWLNGATLRYVRKDGSIFEADSVEMCAEQFMDAEIILPAIVPHVHAAAISEWIKNPADWKAYCRYGVAGIFQLMSGYPAWSPETTYKLNSNSTGKEIISHGQC